ncbi:MAG: hypothetical protein BMS9Abin19_0342 [Gammaproteobacteria bacterium]|nr:MAG: hypothetical protein BMS9Abin19_0342 [Gammaproteobacteria bacterium]
MAYRIKQPETKEEFKRYYHQRWKLLRLPWDQPEGSEVDDIEDQCFHLMTVDDGGKVVGIARLQFNSNNEAQIRYMAVTGSHERQGIGSELIKAMEQHAKKTSHNNIVLDAREDAVNFYKKQGYSVIGRSYLLFDEIQHFRMSKQLQGSLF